MADEITPGEVYRLFKAIEKRLETLDGQMVGRAEYAENQKGIDRRFQANEQGIKDVEASVAAITTRLESAERLQKETRSKWVFQWVALLGAPIIGLLVAMAFRGWGVG